uniref:Uncharacterized protein n=1 Tax=Romanomermis culicivorax TaxID=13658 RepID=A0A915L2X3_ROMCU
NSSFVSNAKLATCIRNYDLSRSIVESVANFKFDFKFQKSMIKLLIETRKVYNLKAITKMINGFSIDTVISKSHKLNSYLRQFFPGLSYSLKFKDDSAIIEACNNLTT